MNMSSFNRSFQENSLGSNPAHFNNPPQSNIKYQQSGIHMPENGGMLKKAIRFQYEFSSARIEPLEESQKRSPEPEVKPFMVSEPLKMQKTQSEYMASSAPPLPPPPARKQSRMPSANMFSCMDSPDYQRDFQISPKIM